MFSRPKRKDSTEPRSKSFHLVKEINRFLKGKPDNHKNDTETNKIRCSYCSTNERLQNFRDLNVGDHISLAGENFKYNILKKQIALYKHHAIVKKVELLKDGSSAILTLIQFNWTPFAKSLKVQETEEIKDLYNDEIYRCNYRHQTNPPKIIIERAEQLVRESEKQDYCLLTYNCEHMVHWCVFGSTKSVQVENVLSKIIKWGNEIGGMIGRMVRLILSCKHLGVLIDIVKLIPEDVVEIAGRSKNVFAKSMGVSVGILFAMILLFLVCSIYKHHKLNKEFEEGEICKACCSRKKWELWLEFIAYLITNGGGFLLLFLCAINWVSGLIFTGSIILSIISMYMAPKLWNMFKGPYLGQQKEISSLDEMKEGDVITIHHWKLKHDCIVSSIIINEQICGRKEGKLKIIHYALESLTSTRQITEDDYDVDLTKERVWVHDYSGYLVFPPNEVIRRARLRIGENKFSVFYNRSPHFCFWAKVNEISYRKDYIFSCFNELQYEKPLVLEKETENMRVVFIDHRKDKILSSCKSGIYPARTREEIQPGDLIEFDYKHISHKAICIEVSCMEKPSDVKLTIIHYGNSYTVVEEVLKFDLNKDTIEVHSHHPVHRFKKEDIIERARAKVGEKKYNIFTNRATHFAEKTVCKSKDHVITSLTELKPGDAFIYRYWGLPHEALLIDIKTELGNNPTEGTLTYVHYGLENLFSTREILEETKFFNVLKTKLQRKGFEGYYTYQNEMSVMRAKSRVGEMRFNTFDNKSSDFVFWCKIIQEPSIFILKSPTKPIAIDIPTRLIVVPHIGKVEEQFQKNWIKTWSELTIGSVIKVRGKHGILEDKDESQSSIALLVYNISKKQIECKQINIDLKKNKERLLVYWWDSRKSFSPQNTIKRAKHSSLHPQFTTEWDFCEYCVIKKPEENSN